MTGIDNSFVIVIPFPLGNTGDLFPKAMKKEVISGFIIISLCFNPSTKWAWERVLPSFLGCLAISNQIFQIFVTVPGVVLYSFLTKSITRLCTFSMSFICPLSSPIHSMQCCVAVRAFYIKQQTLYFWMKGRGRGVDSFAPCSYSIWVQCLNNFVADFCLHYNTPPSILTTPEKVITYRNALCLSPQNFA